MMRKAKSLSSDHVMTYDADALLSLYGGDLVRAKVAAMRAAKLGRHLPFRYCFMTSLCMIDAISGNYESAIASGEKALQLQPRTSEKPYPPTIRYLAACYTKIGKEERAGELFESLREADRKVGHTSRFDSDYVMPSLEIADFLRLGQKLLSD
jgi:tetratricopeptide (TPR) repeat protein